jgi:hypothetical protein
VIARLATVDDDVLWTTAERVRAAEAEARAAAEAALDDADVDPEIIETIEARSQATEVAEAHLSQLGRLGVRGGFLVLAAAGVDFATGHHRIALALLAVICVGLLTLAGMVLRVAQVRRRRRSALAVVGADSYTGFHLRRVSTLLDGESDRRRRAESAQARAGARAHWRHLAGDATVEWAMANRGLITEERRRLADRERGSTDAAAMAQRIITRMAQLHHGRVPGASLPLVLDEPFTGLPIATKQWLLELVSRSAGAPQCVILTDDADLIAWARIEAIGGELAVVETTTADRCPSTEATAPRADVTVALAT